ncbi:MAG TPA: AAA family ATPase, partial [Thermoplasmata archaeon]|nr:AAA family ATPase [Thermoplasmata archaeon]
LLHREQEIDHLAAVLSTALRGETPSNVFVYGQTGTGKTAVAKYIGREIEKINRRGTGIMQRVSHIYINCKIVNTTYGVLANIGNSFIRNWGEDLIPFTGWPTEKVYEQLKRRIDEVNGVAIIFLDEVDQLFYNSGDDVLYYLSSMNSDLSEAKISLIGISNDLRFTELLNPKVRSRLGEERITFKPYKASQLYDILVDRAESALKPGTWDDGVIRLCSALAAEENGDARKAIDLLRIAAEITDRDGASRIGEEHVRRATVQIERDVVSEVISDLPLQQKLVLLAITIENLAAGEKLITGEVYRTYNILARRLNMNVLTQRSISGMVSELDMLGIITAKLISKGRYGRTKEIALAVDPKLVRNVLQNDQILSELIGTLKGKALDGWKQISLI